MGKVIFAQTASWLWSNNSSDGHRPTETPMESSMLELPIKSGTAASEPIGPLRTEMVRAALIAMTKIPHQNARVSMRYHKESGSLVMPFPFQAEFFSANVRRILVTSFTSWSSSNSPYQYIEDWTEEELSDVASSLYGTALDEFHQRWSDPERWLQLFESRIKQNPLCLCT
ncbi:hypothetical protein KC926_03295 [Candidatus Kaiserbacteria bacterium]|nr:hypothetical protein [Candidatus Kaiserbacteria bacterium]